MKLATLKNGTRDGRLVVVSSDLREAVDAVSICPTMQAALEQWDNVQPALQWLYANLNEGQAQGAFAFDPAQAMAPLPRSYQFVDASSFLNHGSIMERAYNLTVDKQPGVPILVPRQGDDFRGAYDDYEFPTADDQCDFEGEVAVVTGAIPMGSDAATAGRAIKLLVLLNDISMRAHLIKELKVGFGLIRAKTATIFSPVAVTPDELGDAWQDGRVHLDLHVHRNGEPFGHPSGGQMDFSFADILAHIAYNRQIGPGMVLGSGTFSNPNYQEVGSACLAERRAIEVIESGNSTTPWMQFGERLRFEMLDRRGASIFGAIDQKFVPSGTV